MVGRPPILLVRIPEPLDLGQRFLHIQSNVALDYVFLDVVKYKSLMRTLRGTEDARNAMVGSTDKEGLEGKVRSGFEDELDEAGGNVGVCTFAESIDDDNLVNLDLATKRNP